MLSTSHDDSYQIYLQTSLCRVGNTEICKCFRWSELVCCQQSCRESVHFGLLFWNLLVYFESRKGCCTNQKNQIFYHIVSSAKSMNMKQKHASYLFANTAKVEVIDYFYVFTKVQILIIIIFEQATYGQNVSTSNHCPVIHLIKKTDCITLYGYMQNCKSHIEYLDT